MLSLRNNFVFVHIPKTGGNSFQSVVEPYSDDRRQKTEFFHDMKNLFDVRGPVTGKKHFSSADYIERLGYDAFMRLKKVTFVRDPFDRAVSFYFSPFRWMRQTPEGPRPIPPAFDKASFIALLDRIAPASELLSYKSRLIPFDFVGRFENYDEDFAKALLVCGLDVPKEIPRVNRGLAKPPLDWDKEMLDAVERRFAADFRNFGYSRPGL